MRSTRVRDGIGRRTLVILGNFEQLVDHAGATLGVWIERAPDACFLVTSRERLGLADEIVDEVEPMDPSTEAVALFEARARAHVPAFQLEASNRSVVEDIGAMVDGIPLAIELAASRLRLLSLEQRRDRLHDRLAVLGGGRRGRHETLRAALEWSWDLLAPWERSGAAQATVFEGGFTLDAAEAVMDLSGHERAPSVVDVIQALTDKSWIRTRAGDDAPRFTMYATVQAFAAEALDGAAASAPDHVPPRARVEARHGRHYAELGASDTLRDIQLGGRLHGRARVELDNLVATCRRAVVRGDPDAAVRALSGVREPTDSIGPHALSVDLAREVLDMPSLGARDRTRAGSVLGMAQATSRVRDAIDSFEEALDLFREVDDVAGCGVALCQLSGTLRVVGRSDEALRCGEQALTIARRRGDRELEGRTLMNLGLHAFRRPDGRRAASAVAGPSKRCEQAACGARRRWCWARWRTWTRPRVAPKRRERDFSGRSRCSATSGIATRRP